jgi:hypothetical protein
MRRRTSLSSSPKQRAAPGEHRGEHACTPLAAWLLSVSPGSTVLC